LLPLFFHDWPKVGVRGIYIYIYIYISIYKDIYGGFIYLYAYICKSYTYVSIYAHIYIYIFICIYIFPYLNWLRTSVQVSWPWIFVYINRFIEDQHIHMLICKSYKYVSIYAHMYMNIHIYIYIFFFFNLADWGQAYWCPGHEGWNDSSLG
jgi:hypothetical protein